VTDGESSAENRLIVRGPGEGRMLRGSGGTPTIVKARGEDVAGAYTLLEIDVPPGPGARPHIHHEADEAFYVVAGTLTIQVEEEVITASAGAYVLVPRGARHRFWNASDEPAKAVFICSPPGFERFFEELSDLREASPNGQLAFDMIRQVGWKYGTEFFDSGE
jgi:quercetin dioxygenase-like cupin family protein